MTECCPRLLAMMLFTLSIVAPLTNAQSLSPVSCGTVTGTTTTTTARHFTEAVNPTRTIETENVTAKCVTKTHTVEAPSINGDYALVSSAEQQTIQLDAHSIRVIQRVFGSDPDGRPQLLQVIEEDTTTSAGQGTAMTRSTYNIDLSGNRQLVRREVQEKVPTGNGGAETKSTVFMYAANGFVPVQKARSIEQHAENGQTETQASILTDNGNGDFVPSTLMTVSVKDSDGTRTVDERVFSAVAGDVTPITDSLVRRTVSRTSTNMEGEQTDVRTYLPTIFGEWPGTANLARELNSVKTTMPDGTIQTQAQVRELNLARPSNDLRLAGQVTRVSRMTGLGQIETKTTALSWDGNQGLYVVEVATTQSISRRH